MSNLAFGSNEDRPDLLLADDRAQQTIRENVYAYQNREILQQEPVENSWLDKLNLKAKIEAVIENQCSLSISDFIERLPSNEKIDEICESVELSLGLSLEWEDIAAPGSDKRDLVFSWE